MSHMILVLLAALPAPGAPARAQGAPLNIVATVPDLGEIAKVIGGNRVQVTTLVQGPQDPHFLEARPSFILAASKADLFLKTGMELEIGFESRVTTEARNGKVKPGGPGNVDCSADISKLEVPSGAVDRSRGDVHPLGNPHYLMDPLNVIVAGQTIHDALVKADGSSSAAYDAGFADLKKRIYTMMFGADLAPKGELYAQQMLLGHLQAALTRRKLLDKLGGLAKITLPCAGKPLVGYHAGGLTYMLQRYGVVLAGALEPLPGIPPSSAHLAELIKSMREKSVKAIFIAPYNARGEPEKVASETGAKVYVYAHQVGSVPEARDLFSMHEYNARLLAAALGGP